MIDDVLLRAAAIEAEYGPDVQEALERWLDAGGLTGGEEARSWLSVAFLFKRQTRTAAR